MRRARLWVLWCVVHYNILIITSPYQFAPVCLEDCYQAPGFQCKNYPLRTLPSATSLLQLALMRSSDRLAIDELLRLDSSYRPGITVKQFFQLFTICKCGLIMTRNAFTRHLCRYIIVDLTTQSDSEEESATAASIMMELDGLN